MSLYTYAGVSRRDGNFKVRFSTRASYTEALIKAGDCDIDMIQLRNPMTKMEAIEYLFSIDFDNGNAEVRAAMELARDKRAERAAAAEKPRRPRKPKAPTVDEIREALVEEVLAIEEENAASQHELEDEEAPF
jgi:hypothetical protein